MQPDSWVERVGHDAKLAGEKRNPAVRQSAGNRGRYVLIRPSPPSREVVKEQGRQIGLLASASSYRPRLPIPRPVRDSGFLRVSSAVTVAGQSLNPEFIGAGVASRFTGIGHGGFSPPSHPDGSPVGICRLY